MFATTAGLSRFARMATTRSFSATAPPAPNTVMKLGNLNHVAIAVPDVAKAASQWALLGGIVSPPQSLPEHGVTVVFVNLPGGQTKLELLEKLGEKSPIEAFMTKNPSGGMHHICVEVENITTAAAECTANKIRVLSPPKIGAHGKPVVFLHPKDCNGVLVELEQK
eukprot:gnl/Spiro4/7268_TR3804_c0_g1_i1.p1 gnl/Spiro4/7268_TR3804_c0_g1~~gnl/Spiro4/7268_TR3804_c0_g1_i1.p1  ORF type:complete len:176 (+),score=45.49 gnl/Spiro4/7268_TR3804_c0_g1_i1:33-530(+)